MSIRPMRWHIIYMGYPLTWEDKLLEFPSEEEAIAFFQLCKSFDLVFEELSDVEIKESIYYYDTGYIDMTGKTIKYEEAIDDFIICDKEKDMT